MSVASARARARYLKRVYDAYVGRGQSQLTFWHETPTLNEQADPNQLGPYWMTFHDKADYPGPRDRDGIPLLDYRGSLGVQRNPIAIAQYGLGNVNRYLESGEQRRFDEAIRVADWLLRSGRENAHGIWVWCHEFDWEYRDTLRSGWYSGLAQGQGISMLLRAHLLTQDDRYLHGAHRAFEALQRPVADGGVLVVDERGHTWIEEYLVDPPTHILNGFIWALWGVHDLRLATGDPAAATLFDASLATLRARLGEFDTGYWSLYERSGLRMKMLASPFYHRLHIVQLRVLARLTGDPTFTRWADRWEGYARSTWNRRRAFAEKVAFKVVHY